MDTKMKLPELVVVPIKAEWFIRAEGTKPVLDEAAAKEVIARCNAAPKLVEALLDAKAWIDATDEEPQDMVKCYEANMKMRHSVRAILKETGAEK